MLWAPPPPGKISLISPRKMWPGRKASTAQPVELGGTFPTTGKPGNNAFLLTRRGSGILHFY